MQSAAYVMFVICVVYVLNCFDFKCFVFNVFAWTVLSWTVLSSTVFVLNCDLWDYNDVHDCLSRDLFDYCDLRELSWTVIYGISEIGMGSWTLIHGIVLNYDLWDWLDRHNPDRGGINIERGVNWGNQPRRGDIIISGWKLFSSEFFINIIWDLLDT